MSSFMACILAAGLTVLLGILIGIFVYIFERDTKYPIKTYLKPIGLFTLVIFSMYMITYIIDYLFGFIGIFILMFVILIYTYKPVYEYRKELENQYKNGKISKEELDRRKKELAELIHDIPSLTYSIVLKF